MHLCSTLFFKILFAAFIVLFVLFSFIKSKKQKSKINGLGGRQITVFPLVATLVTSQYGWLNGVFETYFSHGATAWLVLSLPYLLINFIWIKLSLFLRNQQAKIESTPLLIEKYYGKKTAWLAALVYVWAFLPFMYIKMGGELLQSYLALPSWIAICIFALISAIPFFRGGFQNLVRQDVFLFFAMYFGLALICFSLPFSHFSSLISHANYIDFNLDTYILWLLLSLIVFIDPAVHQRIWAAHSNQVIQKSFKISLLFWLLFDLLVFGIVVQVHNKSPNVLNVSDLIAYLNNWQGLVFAILAFSVVLSTANTYFFVAANTFHQTILKLKNKQYQQISGIILLLFVCSIIYFNYDSKSVLAILFDFYPLVISALFFPVLFAILPIAKLNGKQVFWQMIVSAGICIFIQINSIKISIFETSNAIVCGLLTAASFQLVFYLYNYATSKKKRQTF